MSKQVSTLVVGPFAVNCFVYYDEQTSDAVIIDPGAEEAAISVEVKRLGVKPLAILLTHGHGDHIAAVAAIKEQFSIPLYVGAGEENLLANPSDNVSAFFGEPIVSPPADHLLTDEQMVKIGSIELRVLSTPGHTPGGVCYLDERQGWLFCGDSLFAGSIGRTDFPGSSHTQLIQSINQKIMKLPDSVVCLPGHGPRTTVGAERTSNPFLTGGQFA
ncbi:MAG: MBL fold metallo-hydrolase [Candidatus Zixiibacteriota bacterium]|nr:MAG: MBL fold metallo-hydrolase [candidate division Zixibacteria bacterium]